MTLLLLLVGGAPQFLILLLLLEGEGGGWQSSQLWLSTQFHTTYHGLREGLRSATCWPTKGVGNMSSGLPRCTHSGDGALPGCAPAEAIVRRRPHHKGGMLRSRRRLRSWRRCEHRGKLSGENARGTGYELVPATGSNQYSCSDEYWYPTGTGTTMRAQLHGFTVQRSYMTVCRNSYCCSAVIRRCSCSLRWLPAGVASTRGTLCLNHKCRSRCRHPVGPRWCRGRCCAQSHA